MKLWCASVGLLAALSFMTEAQAKKLQAPQVYAFGEVGEGRWVAIPPAELPIHTSVSRIECSATKITLDMTWGSNSGDWTIFDTYQSHAPFFSRTIKFAQSDQTITLVQPSPTASPSVNFLGDGAKQYAFLLDEFPIKQRAQDLPFALPKCAQGLYGAQPTGQLEGKP